MVISLGEFELVGSMTTEPVVVKLVSGAGSSAADAVVDRNGFGWHQH